MHDATLVGVGERLGHVAQESDGISDRQRIRPRQPRAQRFAFDERHRVIGEALRLSRGEHRHDVRVLQLGGEQDLTVEPLDVHAGGEFLGQHLHHDFPPQRCFFGDEHPRHSAAAEFALERVGGTKRGLQLVAHQVLRSWFARGGSPFRTH